MPVSFKVGAGKADITDTRHGLVMAGYAYEKQKTDGTIDLPLFARAFVIEEKRTSPRRLCLVVIDAWSAAEPLKSKVLAKLKLRFGTRYTRSNLILSATHTHSGPGGYSHHLLYNLTTGGHDQTVLAKMVDGIVRAIGTANANLADGKVSVAEGDLTGCGDNRSVAAYRANPEGQAADAYDRRTDRNMTLLRFAHLTGSVETEIGLYSIFAIHPTNLGMFNTEISGDNKGWAAKFCEEVKQAGYVAAFANANAGDVSPNVTVSAAWQTLFDVPTGSPKPADAAELAANKTAMKAMARLQSDHALALASGVMTELAGRLGSRSTHIDFANLQVGSKRTAKAAIGVSFAAGSHEDSIALASFGPLNIEPEISEGTTLAQFAAGKAQTKAITNSFTVDTIANDNSVIGVVGSVGLLTVTGKLDDVRADALARSWVFGTWARALFPGEVENHDPQAVGQVRWEWNVPHHPNWPATYQAAHGKKPVVFPVGITELKKRQGLARTVIDQALVPHRVPLQITKIGGLVLAAVANEFTTVAGYRLKARLKSIFGMEASHVSLIGYANDYAFYVTTPEEYDTQHYEGASTLYGPHTLAAFLQETGKLATALKNGTAITAGQPDAPIAIYFKT